jgi:hypothetical protein
LTLGFLATLPVYLLSILISPDRFWGMPFPTALGECAEYVRLESEPYDIVQDSAGDPSSLLTGISERRTYVGLLAFQRFVGMKDVVSMYDQRLAFNDRLLHSHSIDQLRELIKESQIRWYILWPDARPNWPESLLLTPLFERAGFRVYDLHQLKE